MTITFSDIASVELTRRLSAYRSILAGTPQESIEEKRTELNHRYLCLQWAVFMDSGGIRPATNKELDEVHEELRRWMREIQRESTVQTMHADGKKIAIIQCFLDATRPVLPASVQMQIQ